MKDDNLTDDLGRPAALLSQLRPYSDNPRNPQDFDPEESKAIRDLVDSIGQVGVREPIQVFRRPDGPYDMLSGHRRKRAVEIINERRERAWRALIEQGQAKESGPRPKELQLIERMPISIMAEPKTKFDREADMWLAESQRQKWPINRLVPFYRKTYGAAPENIRDDAPYMARRLGLPVSRVRLLNAIVASDTLMSAATEEKELPVAGREKTLRAISRAAKVIADYRPDVALSVTGRASVDERTREILRTRMLEKAREIHRSGRPAGVSLERIAPKLKFTKKEGGFDDRVVVDWATKAGKMIAEDLIPATVRSVKGSTAQPPGDGGYGGDAEPLLVVEGELRKLSAKRLARLSRADLDRLVDRLLAVGASVDSLLTAARQAKRKRE